jgi:hypothetical protein
MLSQLLSFPETSLRRAKISSRHMLSLQLFHSEGLRNLFQLGLTKGPTQQQLAECLKTAPPTSANSHNTAFSSA